MMLASRFVLIDKTKLAHFRRALNPKLA